MRSNNRSYCTSKSSAAATRRRSGRRCAAWPRPCRRTSSMFGAWANSPPARHAEGMPEMQRRVRKVVIVGGGSAGWMTAAALAVHTRGLFSIDVVESEEIGTIGVGEATIPSILQFNRGLQIDEAEFMRATQASLKLAIQFEDWTRPGHSYMHPFGFYGVEMEGVPFHHFWLRHQAQGGTMPSDDFCQNIIAARAGRYGPATDRLPLPQLGYAYHFDAGLYAAFLRRMAEKLGARRHEGKVVSVQQNGESGF